MIIQCSQCGREFEFDAREMGKTAQCECGNMLSIPILPAVPMRGESGDSSKDIRFIRNNLNTSDILASVREMVEQQKRTNSMLSVIYYLCLTGTVVTIIIFVIGLLGSCSGKFR